MNEWIKKWGNERNTEPEVALPKEGSNNDEFCPKCKFFFHRVNAKPLKAPLKLISFLKN